MNSNEQGPLGVQHFTVVQLLQLGLFWKGTGGERAGVGGSLGLPLSPGLLSMYSLYHGG